MGAGGLAVWQMSPTPREPATNLARLRDAALAAREGGATILVTPELALTGYDIGPLDDMLTAPDLLERVGEVAADTEVHLVVGLALRDAGGTWNCSAVVDRTGEIRDVYRKAHLFGDLDRGRFTAGDRPFGLAELDGTVVATVICYDIEFPEPARAAALAGAHVLAVPTANMVPWDVVNDRVVPVRAFENQLLVGYANHHGREGETTYLGRSVVAAPDGTNSRANAEGEEIVVVAFDTAQIEAGRVDATHLADRRPDLYGPIAEPGR